jgi:hypothetical protein
MLLKFNGLQENAYYAENTEPDVAEEETPQVINPQMQPKDSNSCTSKIVIGNFSEAFDGTKDNCVGIVCRDGKCGVRILRGDRDVAYADAPELLEEASKTLIAGSEVDDPSSSQPSDSDQPASTSIATQPKAEEIKEQPKSKQADQGLIAGIVSNLNKNRYGYHSVLWISIISWTLFFSTLGFMSSILPRAENERRKIRQSQFPVFVLVSAISGLLTFSLFAGGFVSGSLFPSFNSADGKSLPSALDLQFIGDEWFKLAVWAYISGFYERFVPNILSTLTSKASIAEEKKQPEPEDEGREAKVGA